MNTSPILIQKQEHIGIITLNRPEKLNTFSIQLAKELNKALLDMDTDQDVRVIVIKGAGEGFCAGIDITEIEGKSPIELKKWEKVMNEWLKTVTCISKPVIASAHKIAVANGIGIVAAADLAIVAEGTKFGSTAINVGLFCMVPAVPLSRCIGRKKALELLLTGDVITAEEAFRIGLVNKVVPKDELEAETMALAKKLAAKSPLALQIGKRSFYKMADLEYSKALDMTGNDFVILSTTEDSREGIDAFLKKRSPEWKLK